jgi:hypothetical protein
MFRVGTVFKRVFASNGEGILQTLNRGLSKERERSSPNMERGGGKEERG